MRDRYNHLAKILRKKLSDEKKESGIDPEMTDIEHALEELIEIEDAAETDQAVVNEQKNRKINQDRGNGEDIGRQQWKSLVRQRNERQKMAKKDNGNEGQPAAER